MENNEETKIVVKTTKVSVSFSDGFNFGLGFFVAGIFLSLFLAAITIIAIPTIFNSFSTIFKFIG